MQSDKGLTHYKAEHNSVLAVRTMRQAEAGGSMSPGTGGQSNMDGPISENRNNDLGDFLSAPTLICVYY